MILNDVTVKEIRGQIEPEYTDTVDVIGFTNVVEDGITTEREGIIGTYDCYVSFMYGERELYEEDYAPKLRQRIKIFTKPEYEIPPGSKLIVHKYGHELEFRMSGCPSYYPTHQEIACVIGGSYAG